MEDNLKFLFKPKFYTTYLDAREMTEIEIFSICLHEETKKLSEKVKSEQTAEGERNIKQKMLSFYPSIDPCKRPKKISNGIFQFDIDQKDNPNLNMEELKQKIIAYTCTVYGKISPRGGLKFAVQTNFHNIVSDDTQNYDDIFSRAHDLVYSEIKSEVGEFENDDCTKNIMQTCILSYDHCIYLNLEPEPILFSQDQINKFQEEIAAQCSSSSSNGIFDAHDDLDELQDEFLNLLSGIPQCLDFNSRRPVNFTALYLFGEQGRHIMQSHWIVEDRKKLEQDLKSQMQSAKYHCMNKVRALSTNYSNVSNTLPGWSCAAPSAMVFQERMSIDEARVVLRKAIDAFVDNPKNTIIKAPCGIGKSTYMAKILADMSHKVLYLSPSHSLTGRCCKSLTTKDSLRESMVLDAEHEQAISRPLSHDELVQLQRVAQEAGVSAHLCRQGHDLARAA